MLRNVTRRLLPRIAARLRSACSFPTFSCANEPIERLLSKWRVASRTEAQRLVPGIYARPDFWYGSTTVVFIDGPVHEYPNIAERDTTIRASLDDAGYLVIAFGADEAAWDAVLDRYPSVFGKPARVGTA